MFKTTQSDPDSKRSPGDVILIFMCLLTPAIVGLIILIRYIMAYRKSRRFKPKTQYPRYPPWLSGNLCTPKLRDSVYPFPGFSVYTKEYTMQMWNNRDRVQEKDKAIMKKMRKMMGRMYDITCDWEIMPDSTCIISMPKLNFKSGTMPGTFIPIHGGPPNDSYFEYQMIGDYRIQVTYYVVGGVNYVAGICIYIENPYQETIQYNESVIWKLMNEPDYWSTYNLKEESIHICLRKAYRKPMIVTKNKYEEEYQWTFNDDLKCFELFGPIRESSYEMGKEEDPKIQSKFMEVKLCENLNEVVMITEKNGRVVHANWNKNTKEIDLFPCESCNRQDDPPPSYLLAVTDN